MPSFLNLTRKEETDELELLREDGARISAHVVDDGVLSLLHLHEVKTNIILTTSKQEGVCVESKLKRKTIIPENMIIYIIFTYKTEAASQMRSCMSTENRLMWRDQRFWRMR